jgi:acetolactate synthase I/III small subunit
MTERAVPHTFVLYVENRPGVLNRISSLFRRRGYNIESLTVGHTEKPGISRMTIVSVIGDSAAHRVEANIYKLVNVLSVEDVTFASTVARSLALIKVQASEQSRHRLMEIVRVFRARVVDLAPRSLILEITGAEDKIQALVEVLRPFGIVEMVRTGQVVMIRGEQQREPEPVFSEAAQPRATQGDAATEESKSRERALAHAAEISHSV